MAKRAKATAEVLPIGEDDGDFLTELPDLEWIGKVRNPQARFFDVLSDIPEGGWDHCAIYLYRLEPAISNKAGDPSYIGVYGNAITEESIKREHGGGKYQAYLKYEKKTMRNHRFAIDGLPKLQEGQTPRGNGAAVSGTVMAPGAPDNIASIVEQVIKATKGDPTAATAGIEVMKRAMTDGLDLQRDMMKQQIGSATGSTLGDKLFDSLLIPLLTKKETPTMDPILGKFIEAMIQNMKAERRENPATTPAPGGGGELSMLKDLLGVENLREVLDLGRGAKQQPWWATLIVNAVDKLPALLTEYAGMQERAFQRALIAHQAGAGRPVTLPAAPPMSFAAPPVHVTAPRNSDRAAEEGEIAAMSMQMIKGVIEGICRAYDAGYDGEIAGAHVKMLNPGLVEILRPMFADVGQVASFVAGDPDLAERSRDPEWAEFQADFIAELLATEGEAPEEVPRGPIPVPASSLQAN